jgi:hypothetical protein
MVIVLLPASHGASFAPFDVAPVLSRDVFAGPDLDQPDAARPF